MTRHILEFSAAIVTCLALAGTVDAQSEKSRSSRRRPRRNPRRRERCRAATGSAFRCCSIARASRRVRSTGKPAPTSRTRWRRWQSAHKLPSTGKPDCATWKALGGGSEPTITTYTPTDADVKGPFEKIPPTLAKQAALAGARLPVGARTARGAVSLVAGAAAAAESRRGDSPRPRDPRAGRHAVRRRRQTSTRSRRPRRHDSGVAQADSALRVTRADGTIVFYAPVTTGSEHDPLPIGDWQGARP